ncbi:MAG: hypothetical protein HYT70_02815 [Candidatus Aenigmarchaeota archaeon]|nr:hypothetical protein [Candidatus Aenigmarchaeota archaeon]
MAGLVPSLVYRHDIIEHLQKAFHYLAIRERVEEQANRVLRKYNLNARLMPTKTIGVQGDYRTYGFVLLVQETSKRKRRPYNSTLARLSTRLTNEIKEINKVVILTGGSPVSDDEIFIDNYFLDRDV